MAHGNTVFISLSLIPPLNAFIHHLHTQLHIQHIQQVLQMRRTNLTIVDEELWKWAKKKAIDLEYTGVSEYIFELIRKEKERENSREKRDNNE